MTPSKGIQPLHLKLPATSANLGPGFDALGLAMALYLTVDASVAAEFSIDATGRNADLCGQLKDNLILGTYTEILAAEGREPTPLHLTLQNEIPLGMGCGSSAAALLAGVLLANHFGALGWTSQQILEEACRREGHPDNVAACWLGGMTASAMHGAEVITATCGQNLDWRLLIALPPASLSTSKARALLPPTYTRADAVVNVQNTALLVSAFALGRPELLKTAMGDRIHQPYRQEVCALLPLLLPLSGQPGIYGVALSGAGPSVLLIVDQLAPQAEILEAVMKAVVNSDLEIIETGIAGGTESR
ncbi:homoserine kinase [soil metagenome]